MPLLSRFLLLAPVLLAGSQDGAGEDRFDSSSSLAAYTAHADARGAWEVRGGELLGDGTAIQSVLVRDGVRFADGWVETRTEAVDDGGLVLRFQDNANYYLLAIRDDASPSPRGSENVKLYKRLGGRFIEMGHADVRWPRGEVHTVRLRAAGRRLTVCLDGRLLGGVDDPDPLPAGGMGLRHYGGDDAWQSRFHELRWSGGEEGTSRMVAPGAECE